MLHDGEHRRSSAKNMVDSDLHGYSAGKSDQDEPAVLADQIGNQNVFSNSIGRFIEAQYGEGKYRANIFQKAHGGPTAYQEASEPDPSSENSEVAEVSNNLNILGLFESSGNSFKCKLNSQSSLWLLLWCGLDIP